jgi:dihydropteroate synthase
VAAGVRERAILVDPGLGFGKTVEQNLALVRGTGALLGLGAGVVSGASRKSFVGRAALGRDSAPAERVAGSVAVSVCQMVAGARVFRVHDVGMQASGLRAAWAICGEVGGGWLP